MKDGRVTVKSNNDDPSYTWFEMHGETLNKWNMEVPGLDGHLYGSPLEVDGKLLIGGGLWSTDKDGPARWAIVEMGAGLVPSTVAQGDCKVLKRGGMGRLVKGANGNLHISVWGSGMLWVARLGADLQPIWDDVTGWGSDEAYFVGDRVVMPIMGLSKQLKDVEGGGSWSSSVVIVGYEPMALIWGPDGKHSYHRLLPKGVEAERPNIDTYSFQPIQACGCFVDRSYDKGHPGMVRVAFE